MVDLLNESGRNLLFLEARSHNAWLKKPVPDTLLRQLYELFKWGPTSANTGPARVVFLRTKAAKELLRPALNPPNVDKTMLAPVTAIIGYDMKFYDKLPKLFPQAPMREYFANNPPLIESTAQRNSSLQGGYFIVAARALGLDCGPMSGFDNHLVDKTFFATAATAAGTPLFPGGDVRSNFLCNLGYGDRAQLFPRNPRLDFDEACALL